MPAVEGGFEGWEASELYLVDAREAEFGAQKRG